MIRIASLSPFGPLFGKELRTTARRKRTYFLRAAYLGAMLLLLGVLYLQEYDRPYSSAALSAQRAQETGRDFFVAFAFFSVTAMALIGPVLTATAINGERLHKTLHVLVMTPINAWQIAAGKLFSRLLIVLTLLGLSLPVLAVVRLLGGVELGELFAVVTLALVTGVSSAALGLLLSAYLTRAYAVILLAYAIMLLGYLILPLIRLFLLQFVPTGMLISPEYDPLTVANPFFMVGSIAFDRFGISVGWEKCAWLHLLLSAGLLVAAALHIRKLAATDQISVRVSPTGYVPMSKMKEAGSPETAPSQEVGDNPVLWRELRRPLMARRWQRYAGSIVFCGPLLVLYFGASFNPLDNEVQILFSFLFFGTMILLATVLSATAIAQEKESDTWTLLLSTPIGGHQVVWGKVLGILRRMLWPLMLMAGHYLLFFGAGYFPFPVALVAIWLIFAGSFLWLATGLLLSLSLRRVTTAVVLNLLLPVGLYLVLPALVLIIGTATGWGGALAEQTQWTSPFFFLSGLFSRNLQWLPNDNRVSPVQFQHYALLLGAAYAALALLILWRTAARFDQITGRGRQVEPTGPALVPTLP